MLYILEFNPHANIAANRIIGDPVIADKELMQFKTTLVESGPFFADTHVLRRISTNTELVYGVDYLLGHYFSTASHTLATAIYASIILMDPTLAHDIALDADYLGGDYQLSVADRLEFLNNNFNDPMMYDYETVMPIGKSFPPIALIFDEDRFVNSHNLAEVISSIAESIKNKDPQTQELYKLALDRVNYLLSEQVANDYTSHITLQHAGHNLSYYDVGALAKNSTAANADKIFNMTLEELTAAVQTGTINPDELENYLTKALGGTLKGNLMLANNLSSLSANDGSFKITTNADSLFFTTPTTATIYSFSDTLLGESLQLAGDNLPTFNGAVIITDKNIADYVAAVSTSVFSVVTTDSSTLEFTGDATVTPLSATIKYPEGTVLTAGVVKLMESLESSSDLEVITPNHIKELADSVSASLPSAVTINALPLLGNVKITKTILGLNTVPNLSDSALPISVPQQLEIDKYSPKIHQHPYSEFNIPVASADTAGLGLINANLSMDLDTTFAVESTIKPVVTATADLEAYRLGKFKNGILNLAQYGNIDGRALNITIVGTVITFDNDYPCYMNGKNSIISAASLDIGAGHIATTLEIYIPNRDQLVYAVNSQPDVVVEGIIIGTVTTDDTGNIVANTLGSVIDLNEYNELIAHLEDPDAHGLTSITKSDVGLSAVENRVSIDAPINITFRDIFYSFYRFSHSTTGVQPASTSELNTWEYDSTTDTIHNNTNSATYIGLVSINKFNNYVFDTMLSSIGSDDDWMGQVLAFAVDADGVEHTLSALRCTSNTHPSNNFAIYYDFNSFSSEPIIGHSYVETVATWPLAKDCRMLTTREGTKFNVKCNQFNKTPSLTTMTLELEIDLLDYPELAIFIPPCQYGYGALSQPYSNFKNLITPDQDAGSYLASGKAIDDVENTLGFSSVVVNMLADGSEIPLPAGYTLDECSFLPTLTNANDTWGWDIEIVKDATKAYLTATEYLATETIVPLVDVLIISKK